MDSLYRTYPPASRPCDRVDRPHLRRVSRALRSSRVVSSRRRHIASSQLTILQHRLFPMFPHPSRKLRFVSLHRVREIILLAPLFMKRPVRALTLGGAEPRAATPRATRQLRRRRAAVLALLPAREFFLVMRRRAHEAHRDRTVRRAVSPVAIFSTFFSPRASVSSVFSHNPRPRTTFFARFPRTVYNSRSIELHHKITRDAPTAAAADGTHRRPSTPLDARAGERARSIERSPARGRSPARARGSATERRRR